MAIEVVIFHLQPTITREDFLAAAAETTALLKTQAGFISRNVGQAEGGEWLDILYWDSVADAKNATSLFQTEATGKRFADMIKPDSFQVFYIENATS
jgi:hypothetical protein